MKNNIMTFQVHAGLFLMGELIVFNGVHVFHHYTGIIVGGDFIKKYKALHFKRLC